MAKWLVIEDGLVNDKNKPIAKNTVLNIKGELPARYVNKVRLFSAPDPAEPDSDTDSDEERELNAFPEDTGDKKSQKKK